MGKALEISFIECEVNGTDANQQTAAIASARPFAAGFFDAAHPPRQA
jgi:hypothetical protein